MADSLKNYEQETQRQSGITRLGDEWYVCAYEIQEAKLGELVPTNIKGQRLPMKERAEGCNLPDVAYDSLLGPYVRDVRPIQRLASKDGRGAMLRIVLEGRKLTPA